VPLNANSIESILTYPHDAQQRSCNAIALICKLQIQPEITIMLKMIIILRNNRYMY